MAAPTQPAPGDDDPYRTYGDGGDVPADSSTRFQILRPHARGNLGEVFVAHDAELHREVALKEIQQARANDPDSRRRFLVEAEVTGRLEHPGIVPVYSLGTHADGRPYYAMRFIRGTSLLDAIEKLYEDERTGAFDDEAASLALRRALRSIIVACQAIGYAHSRGVIHRDVKPHNIMLGRHGETIVVDWGLARAEGTHHEDAPQVSTAESWLSLAERNVSDLTMAGSLIGTPAYMSPEQAAGRHDMVGPASDIYSLGATLYHLLAGHPPFRGESVAEVLQSVIAGRLPPLHAVKPGVPRPLEAIVSKAMAIDPAVRYATAAELADDIEHWLADQPFPTYKERPAEQFFRWLRRHRSWAIAGFAAIAATALISLLAVRVVDKQRRIARQLAAEKTTLAESERASRQQAITGIYRARAGELAAASRAIRPVRPDLGVLLAVESIEMTTRHGLPIVPAAEESLRESLSQVGGIPFPLQEPLLHMSAAGRWVIGPTQIFDMDAIAPADSGIAHGVRAVTASASADESRIALMADDGSVTVIDANDAVRQPVRVPARERPAGQSVKALRLSPNGRWLLLELDAGCELYDLGDEASLGPALVVGGSAATAVFSPDGGQLAIQAGDADTHGLVHVWPLETAPSGGRAAPLVLAGEIDHQPLAFAPNSRALVTRDGGENSRVRVWDLTNPGDGDVLFTVPGETTAIFLPRGDRLVLTERRGEIKGWRLFSLLSTGGWTLEHVVEIATPEDAFCVACSDTWLVASLTKAEIYAWNITAGGGPRSDLPDRTLRGHDYQATQLAFSRNGRRLVSLGPITTQIWDFTVPHPEVINQTLAPRPGTLLARPDAPAGGATGERVMSPDGHWLAIDGEDSIVRLLDLTSDDPMRHPIELVGHAGKVVFHTFSRDSRWLATGAADHTICVWDLAQMPRASVVERPVAKPAVRFSAEGLDPACLRFGAETGHLWAAGPTSSGGAMVLWEWSPARPDAATRRARIENIAVRPRVAYTLTRDALTVLREDGVVERHLLQKGVPVGPPEPVAEGSSAVIPTAAWSGRGTGPYAKSPDGRWRTTVTEDFGVALVRTEADGREVPIRLPRGGRPDARFQCATFSYDSRVLATGFSDGGLQIWNLAADNIPRSGLVLRGHTRPVQYIEFDRFDRWLVSSSTHSIRLWENDVAKLISIGRKATGRKLNDDERTLFGIDEEWDAPTASDGR